MRFNQLLLLISLISTACYGQSQNNNLTIGKAELREFLGNTLADSNKCPFADGINKLDLSKATENARTAYDNDNIHFYGSVDGFGPSRPNFEFNFTRCVYLKSKWVYIFAGGDAMYGCKNESELRKKAYDYASLFNLEMTKLVRKDAKSYPCPKAIIYK